MVDAHCIRLLGQIQRFHAETNKNPHPASQLHADQTNNKLYLYEKTNTTNKLLYDDYYQGDF